MSCPGPPTTRGRVLPALLWLAASCLCGDGVLAELRWKTGTVSRGRAQGRAAWTVTEVGDRYGLGDAVRTGDRAAASLRIEGGGVLRLRERTLVRFLPGGSSGAALGMAVDTGVALIESGGSGLLLDTEFGTARIEGRGRLRLRAGLAGSPRLAVLLGTARIEREVGPVVLRAGQSIGLPADPGATVAGIPDAAAAKSAPVADSGDAARGPDAGSAEAPAAPRRPPHNLLDADGRRYSVLFQTLPPSLTLRWRGATAPGPYMLFVQPARGPRRVRAAVLPRHTFASGEFGEGSYRFWFRAADGTRSPESSLRVSRGRSGVH